MVVYLFLHIDEEQNPCDSLNDFKAVFYNTLQKTHISDKEIWFATLFLDKLLHVYVTA